MRVISLFFLGILLCACATLPQVSGGKKIQQPGMSFTLPGNMVWSVLVNSTYQINLITAGSHKNETFVVSASSYKLPAFSSRQEFLEFVRSGRSAEPKTRRFETLRNSENLYMERPETCVQHSAAAKDFGAKRGGDYTIIEYFGMNCIHPNNPAVGVFVEISRKALPMLSNSRFETYGAYLLKSVEFTPYY